MAETTKTKKCVRFVVLTGPSGAGKTLALHSFEDAAYFTADNLPPRMLPELAKYVEGFDRIAVVVDTRSGSAFDHFAEVIEAMRAAGEQMEVLFLDASDDALVQRFKETRRPHPLFIAPVNGRTEEGIIEAIHAERSLLEGARGLADRTIDTSSMTNAQLRDVIHSNYAEDTRPATLVIVTSFGFKHGLPMDADLVFDVRFLSNPFYTPNLRKQTGLDADVVAYIQKDSRTEPFQQRMNDLTLFTLPEYLREGKAYVNIAIGCTGGRHRSVALSEALAETIREQGYHVLIRHRDLAREGASPAYAPDRKSVV